MAATQPAAESSLIAGDTRTADSESRHRLACIAVILIGVVINLLYVLVRCPLDLSGDEAHYWDWSRHLDISYYSKGPLVACIIASSRWLMGLLAPNASLDPAAVVRIPAILLSVLTSIGVVALSRGIGLSWRGVLVALLVCASTPMFTVGAMLMTIDAPFLCAWIWAHVFVVRAIRSEHNLGWWIGTALLVAVGILAKYTMGLLYLVIAVAILSRAGLRKRLLTRTSVIAGAVGLTGLAPIVFWNAAHQWVSFRHVAGQAGVSDGDGLQLRGPIEFLAAQFGVSNPIWVAILITLIAWAMTRKSGDDQRADATHSFVTISTVVVFCVFLGFSFVTKVQPNWPAPAILTGAVLIAHWIVGVPRKTNTQRHVRTLATIGVALGLLISGVGRRTDLLAPVFGRLAAGAPPWELTPAAKYDPAARLRGWRELGAAVGDAIGVLESDGRQPIVLTDDYQVASEIAFYTPGQPDVYCIQSVLGDRLCQYDFWENPIDNADRFIGRSCLYVGTFPAESSDKGSILRKAMPDLRSMRTIEYRVGDIPFQVWTLFVSDAYQGVTRNTSARETHY